MMSSAASPPAPPARPRSRRDEDRYLWEAFRHHSRTFSLATRLLRPEVRLPVATLYLFCRRVDDIADVRLLSEGSAGALRALERTRADLERSLDGNPPDELLWQRLAEVHRRFSLPPAPMYELLEGAHWDITGRPILTEADLIEYSQRVAGCVGLIMLPFLVDSRDDVSSLIRPARALGVAMQITNILRDVGEDLRHLGRIYLPETLRTQYAVSEEDILDATNGSRPTAAYTCLVEHVMGMAEQQYRIAEDGIRALPVRSRLGIAAAARMYREILNEVRAAGYDNLARRNVVDLFRKLRVAAHDDYARRKHRLLGELALQPA